MKKKLIIFFIIIVIYSACFYITTSIQVEKLNTFIITITPNFFAILIGAVIGSLGILIGGFLNIINENINNYLENIQSNKDVNTHLEKLNHSIKELKQDVMFIVSCFCVYLLCGLLKTYELNENIIIIFNSLILASIIYTLIAFFDIISTMFKIYDYFYLLAKIKIKK